MNFFAHAMVAFLQRDQPRFVLGAMLPDLTSMVSVRLLDVRDPDIAAGVALHHETDRRFHACAPFRALCESALVELEASGVSRASARAVGHVGSELLLDGIVSHASDVRLAYARAIEAGLEHGLRELAFKDGLGLERLHELLRWLSDGPLPEGYRDVDFVCERLQRILARRPRLALKAGDYQPVRKWLHGAAQKVERDSGELLAS